MRSLSHHSNYLSFTLQNAYKQFLLQGLKHNHSPNLKTFFCLLCVRFLLCFCIFFQLNMISSSSWENQFIARLYTVEDNAWSRLQRHKNRLDLWKTHKWKDQRIDWPERWEYVRLHRQDADFNSHSRSCLAVGKEHSYYSLLLPICVCHLHHQIHTALAS